MPEAKRQAVRVGSTRSSVVLGGRCIAIKRLRARSLKQLGIACLHRTAQADPLDAATLASIAAGVSTRRHDGTPDALPSTERSSWTSKGAVSRRWVALTLTQLHQWLSRSLKELDLPAVMN